MNKIYFLHFFSLLFLTVLFTQCNKKTEPSTSENEIMVDDFFPRIKSAIGSKENPTARADYWYQLQRDPASGEIPINIRQREIAFSNTLPGKRGSGILKTNATEWTSIGPYNMGGRTRAIAIDITNENNIIAGGVSGGIWKSIDNGENWIKKTNPQSLHSVTSIAQDTRDFNTQVWYYGTGEIQGNSARAPFAPFRGDGIFKSIDNGESWFQLASTAQGISTLFNSQFQYIWKVIVNKFNNMDDEVYAAIVGGISRSIDGGLSWEIVLGEEYMTSDDLDLNDVNAPRFTDIVQTENGIFYAAMSSEAMSGTYAKKGVYRSTDGQTWNQITPSGWPDNFSRVVMAPSKTNPNLLFFLGDSEAGDFLWKYEYLSGNGSNAGGRWENLSSNIPMFGGDVGDYDDQNSYNMALKIHPADENVVYLGGTNLYRSNAGFESSENTSWIGGYDSANNVLVFPNHYVDQHDLVFYENNPDKMLSVNDGGIFISETNRSDNMNWSSLNNGFVTGQSYTIGFDPSTSFGSVAMGFQDNGTYITKNPDFNTRWTRFIGGDGSYCAIAKGEEYIYSSFQNSEIYRFTTNKSYQKESFARIDPIGGGEKENQEYLFVNPYVLDPNNNNIMYLAGGDAIWRNSNLVQIPSGSQQKTSVNWDKFLSTELSESQVSALAVSTFPADIIYYGTSFGELFKIENGLVANPEVNEITDAEFPENGYLISIAVDRTNSDHVMVAFSNYHVQSIFYSDNGGEDFTNISGNLEENPDGSGDGPSVRWVEIVPLRDGSYRYFAATSTGIYSTENLEGINTVWTGEGDGIIGNVVSVMIKHRPADGTVFVATHGSGAYQAIFDDIADEVNQNPANQTSIDAAYPNPFNLSTKVPFSIPSDGQVRVIISNIAGQKIKDLLSAHMYAGKNYVTWDGTNSNGVAVNSGTYILSVYHENNIVSSKLLFNP